MYTINIITLSYIFLSLLVIRSTKPRWLENRHQQRLALATIKFSTWKARWLHTQIVTTMAALNEPVKFSFKQSVFFFELFVCVVWSVLHVCLGWFVLLWFLVSLFCSSQYTYICRKCLDCKLTHYNGCDRIRGVVFSLGHCSARLDCWSCCHDFILFGYRLYFFLSCWLLSCRRPRFRQEKLYLHGRCSLYSW